MAGCQSLDFASAVWFSLLTISHIFYLLVYQASLVWCTLCSKRHCVEAPNNTIFYLKAWLSSMKQVGWGAQSSLRLGWIRAGWQLFWDATVDFLSFPLIYPVSAFNQEPGESLSPFWKTIHVSWGKSNCMFGVRGLPKLSHQCFMTLESFYNFSLSQ